MIEGAKGFFMSKRNIYKLSKFLVLLPVFSVCACANTPSKILPENINKLEQPSNIKNQATQQIFLKLKGHLEQSGVIIGETIPHSKIYYKNGIYEADADGNFILGFDRDEALQQNLKIIAPNGQELNKTLNIAPRTYQITVVNGLPKDKVIPPESSWDRIKAEKAIKDAAFASSDESQKGYLQSFRWPLDNVRITSPWGAARNLNGVVTKPHYGVDFGATTGTPIYAPADGKVILAQPDMYFEGGIVGIDHGKGLISFTMHMSKIDVSVGQIVKKGQLVGAVGATGRATGPHLHWSMRWNGNQLDPSLMVGDSQEIKTDKPEIK